MVSRRQKSMEHLKRKASRKKVAKKKKKVARKPASSIRFPKGRMFDTQN